MIINKQILAGCKKGKRQAQEDLYRLLYIDLMQITKRYVLNTADSEDILNRAMLKVFTKINEFKGDHDNLGGWIKRILINECLDFLRSRKSFTEKHITSDTLPEFGTEDVGLEEDPNNILKLLERLPKLSATVFNLFAIEGYSHKEIAKQLEISVANSKWNLHHARKNLKVWIKEKDLI